MRTGLTALVVMAMAAGLMASGPAHTAAATLDRTTTSSGATSFPGSNGRIAYVKRWNEGGRGSDIFTVRPNGVGNKRLTYSHDARKPIWSPSGGRIAFQRAGAVWVMRSDGAGKEQLTDGQLVGWLPTGGRILVVRYADEPEVDPTWVVHDVATGAEDQLPIDLPLVDDPDPPYPDYSEWKYATDPTLSPDGELLAVMLWRYDDDPNSGYTYYHGSILTVRLDGTELTRVPRYSHSWASPHWSPDGDEIVYWAEEPRGYCSGVVSSVKLDGSSGSVHVSQRCALDNGPAWSPDGTRVVFTNGRSDTLHVASLDGSRIRKLLPSAEGVRRLEPDWRAIN